MMKRLRWLSQFKAWRYAVYFSIYLIAVPILGLVLFGLKVLEAASETADEITAEYEDFGQILRSERARK